jgi:hypothetical protein
MKVDMSPAAVEARLNAMGQLWELSVALLDSSPPEGVGSGRRRWRAAAIQDSIRKVLMVDWDPIGVRGVPQAIAEYDSYIGPLYRILAGNGPMDDIVDCLERLEREEIGVCTSEQVRRRVAEKLSALDLSLG